MASNDEIRLSDEQLSLLVRAKEIKDSGDDPVILAESDVATIKDVLADALSETTGLKSPESLSVTQIAMQLEADADDVVDNLAERNQTPETGGVPDDDAETDNLSGVEAARERLAALDPADAQDLKVKLSKAKSFRLNDRLPNHSDELVEEVADELDVSTEAVERLVDDAVSDPRLAYQQ